MSGSRRVSFRLAAGVAAVLGILVTAAVVSLLPSRQERVSARLRLAGVLGEDEGGGEAETAGYARALEPRAFSFPADHGSHPRFRTEWWYFTGNLAGPDDRRFGFELTFFRFALAPEPPHRASRWATNQVWMAHLALSDIDGGRFHAFERLRRGALGLAGATRLSEGAAEPYRVWLDTWQAVGTRPGRFVPTRLEAAQDGVGVNLTLTSATPPVLHGDRGLSRKGPRPGDASYYYSLPRMAASGTIELGGRSFAVAGQAWLDREWSTSALGADEVGWDWFGLQLDDGRELMLYRLRRRDGSASSASSGTLVDRDGAPRHLPAEAIELAVLDRWRSPATGTVYPAGWRLRVPREGLDLRLRPLLADQELDLSLRYWEGAVAVSGTAGGRPVGGRGYAELTGYGDAPPP